MNDPLPQTPPPRRSTLRRRLSFAVPVVFVTAFGAGCADEEKRTVNPPPQSTIRSTTTMAGGVIANPPPATGPGATTTRP